MPSRLFSSPRNLNEIYLVRLVGPRGFQSKPRCLHIRLFGGKTGRAPSARGNVMISLIRKSTNSEYLALWGEWAFKSLGRLDSNRPLSNHNTSSLIKVSIPCCGSNNTPISSRAQYGKSKLFKSHFATWQSLY